MYVEGGGDTVIGNGAYIMTNGNVDHDCYIEDEVTLAAGVTVQYTYIYIYTCLHIL